MGWYALIIIPIIVFIILFKTLRFKPKGLPEMRKRHEINEQRVIESLSKMLQFKTVSHLDSSLMDDQIFKQFRTFLKERYPLINSQATYSEHERGVLFQIKGQSDEYPTVFMSHYDVVPENGKWKEDPFSGRIDDKTVGPVKIKWT